MNFLTIHPIGRAALKRLVASCVIAAVTVGCSHYDPATAVHSAAPPCAVEEEPLSVGHDAATENDDAFARAFRHCFATVDNVQMHYVIGGSGAQTLVLLHGWPESWYEYWRIMPQLLPGRTVIAVDLPGLGDTTGEPPSYTKTVLAEHISKLLSRLGHSRDVRVVGHDFGAGVAYALAAKHRKQIAGLFLMDFPLVGRSMSFASVQPLSWHFAFNVQKPLAEELVSGRVDSFLEYFFRHSEVSEEARARSTHELPIPRESLTEYARVYSRPQVLRGGFELYRTWSTDEVENRSLQREPLTIPVRLLTQDGLEDVMAPPVRDAAANVSASEIQGAGHWLVEERPDQVVDEIDAFYPAS